MKKLLLTVAFALMLGLGAIAQRGDEFFNNWNDVSNGLDRYDEFDNGFYRGDPVFPGHGGGNTPAPLGSGLVVLTALGAGYAVARRKKED